MKDFFSDHWRILLGRESDAAKVWRDYKVLRWTLRVSTPFFLFPVLSVQLSLPFLVRLVGWTMVAIGTYGVMRLGMWQCPRCKGRFFAKELPTKRGWRNTDLSTQRCLNCGLLRP